MASVWGNSWAVGAWAVGAWAEIGAAPVVGYGLNKVALTGLGGDDLGDEEVSEESS